jgi:hypothetical protein
VPGRALHKLTLANHSRSQRHSDRKVIRVNKTLGTILIALGLVGLLWGGITYTTTEKILDIGPIEASRDESHTIPLPPLAGAAALIGGIVLLVSGKKA